MELFEKVLEVARLSHPHSVVAVRRYLEGASHAIGQQMLRKWSANPQKFADELAQFTLSGTQLSQAGREFAMEFILHNELNNVLSCCVNAHLYGGYVELIYPAPEERRRILKTAKLPDDVYVANLKVVMPLEDGTLPEPKEFEEVTGEVEIQLDNSDLAKAPGVFANYDFSIVEKLAKIARKKDPDGPVKPNYDWVEDKVLRAELLGLSG